MPKEEKKYYMPYGNGGIRRKEGRESYEYRKVLELPDGTTVRLSASGKTPQLAILNMEEKEKKELIKFKTPSNKVVLCDEMYDWLENVKKQTLKAQSYERLKSTIKNQIECSEIGYLRYQNVTTRDIQQLIASLNDNHYSYSVIKKTFDALNNFYRYISARDKIDNPMLLVQMPTQANTNHEAREVIWFEEDDIEKFIEEAQATWNTGNPKYQGSLVYAANIYMGLRIGELLALQWKDLEGFDTDKPKIRVSKTLIEKSNPNYDSNIPNCKKTIFEIQKSNKTNKIRKVPVMPRAKALLKKHYLRTPFKEPDDYIISTKNRRYTTAKNADDTIKKIQENAGTRVQGASTHTLRHTCASILFKAGIPIEMICKILGNSREVCEKTYVHFTEKWMDNVTDITNEYMTQALNKLNLNDNDSLDNLKKDI